MWFYIYKIGVQPITSESAFTLLRNALFASQFVTPVALRVTQLLVKHRARRAKMMLIECKKFSTS